MTEEEKILWYKIENFELDAPKVKLTFSGRLARENGWTKQYALCVIEEYKKFIFLCCVSPSSVTPSDPVDQAWHLHLTYTKSYWTDFCRNTLNREIHHNPTKGGKAERKKYNSCYTGLQDIYKEKFNTPPPKNIWQDNTARFTKINFQRVSLDNYWLIKKPSLTIRKLTLFTAFIVAVTISINATGAVFIIVIASIMIIAGIIMNKNNKKGNNSGNGCNSGSCSNDDSHSGCNSGCSGCGGCGD